MTFRVGQKVVCIDSEFPADWMAVENLPQQGEVYTVRGAGTHNFLAFGIAPVIWLREIHNPVKEWSNYSGKFEIGFWSERFRPLIENETDITFAHEILRKVSKTKETVA